LSYRNGQGLSEIHADDLNSRFKQMVGDEYPVRICAPGTASCWRPRHFIIEQRSGNNAGRHRRHVRRGPDTGIYPWSIRGDPAPGVAQSGSVPPCRAEAPAHKIVAQQTVERVGQKIRSLRRHLTACHVVDNDIGHPADR
jgi:hypothetical protein